MQVYCTKVLAVVAALCLLGGCNNNTPSPKPAAPQVLSRRSVVAVPALPATLASTVLVVGNAANQGSVTLANYYAGKRGVPSGNVLLLTLPATYTPDNADTCTLSDYQTYIAAPIYKKIASLPHIDYIVLCRNLPVKIQIDSNVAYDDESVDNCIAANSTSMTMNPYQGMTTPFNSTTYGMYLVCRLDGWSWADATALVDHSMAATPTGIFFVDQYAGLDSYSDIGDEMNAAYEDLLTLKIPAQYNHSNSLVMPPANLGGYISYGSDAGDFKPQALTFEPGAEGEYITSTSAINLRFPAAGESNGGALYNQSQIGTLIHEGITGVQGYVAEPYAMAMADPSQLFPAYVSGMNLAESFYSASWLLGWKAVVVGDPLCNPYGASATPTATVTPTSPTAAIRAIVVKTTAPAHSLYTSPAARANALKSRLKR